jgi:hypothetical protein
MAASKFRPTSQRLVHPRHFTSRPEGPCSVIVMTDFAVMAINANGLHSDLLRRSFKKAKEIKILAAYA